MTKFLNGPAAGVTLMLKRSPAMLRVTRGGGGKFDALDQLNDAPEAYEDVFAYRLVKQDGTAHIRFGGKSRQASGFYSMATYEFCEQQPTQEVMRSQAQWRGWATAEFAKRT